MRLNTFLVLIKVDIVCLEVSKIGFYFTFLPIKINTKTQMIRSDRYGIVLKISYARIGMWLELSTESFVLC